VRNEISRGFVRRVATRVICVSVVPLLLFLLLCIGEHDASACSISDYGMWHAENQGSARLWPANGNVCWLTTVAGNFDGTQGPNDTGPTVQVMRDGYWWLTTGYNEFANAYCIPMSCLSGANSNYVVWESQNNISIIANAHPTCDSETNSTSAWWGDAITLFQSWPGSSDTNGAGEHARVTQSTQGSVSSVLDAEDCTADQMPIHPTFSSVFVGTPSSGIPAQIASTGWTTGSYTIDMLTDATQAFCYLTYLQGKWRGGAESAQVYTVNGHWYAASLQGSSGSQIGANYACVWYHQNH
jgi:hypothetical protein